MNDFDFDESDTAERWGRNDDHLTPEKKQARAHYRNSQMARAALSGDKDRSGLRTEILELHARGKDVGQIAVWTNVPVSAVAEVIRRGRKVGI